MLFEEVRQATGRCRRTARPVGVLTDRTGADAAQGGEVAVDGLARIGEGLFEPVVVEGVPLVVGEVVLGRLGEERQGNVQADAQAPRVHGRVQQCARRGRGAAVAAQQLGRTGQELGQTPVACVLQGMGELLVAGGGQGLGSLDRLPVEGIGQDDLPACEQLSSLRVRVRPDGFGKGAVGPGVRGPQGAQDQDGGAGRVVEQQVQDCGDPFARSAAGSEVVLGLVEPHHRVRHDAFHVCQCRLGMRRVAGVPQQPALFREGLYGFPARAGLARRRGADASSASCGRCT